MDEILPAILKHSCESLLVPLTHVINLSSKQGIFSHHVQWLQSFQFSSPGTDVISGIIDQYQFYQPSARYMRKNMAIRLINYLENNKLLSKHQNGFRKNYSTETATLHFVNNIYKLLEDKH